jgi:hypothetical protein
VTQMIKVPAVAEFTSIVLESNWPEGKVGVPVALAWTVNESVAPQQGVAGRVTGLPAESNVVKVGGKVGD